MPRQRQRSLQTAVRCVLSLPRAGVALVLCGFFFSFADTVATVDTGQSLSLSVPLPAVVDTKVGHIMDDDISFSSVTCQSATSCSVLFYAEQLFYPGQVYHWGQ